MRKKSGTLSALHSECHCRSKAWGLCKAEGVDYLRSLPTTNISNECLTRTRYPFRPLFQCRALGGPSHRSALGQAWPDKDVFVVDDGSADGSIDVIRCFGDRIRWETGPNRGGNAGRNRLLELARGEWLQYLDADDYILPDKVARQMGVPARARRRTSSSARSRWNIGVRRVPVVSCCPYQSRTIHGCCSHAGICPRRVRPCGGNRPS